MHLTLCLDYFFFYKMLRFHHHWTQRHGVQLTNPTVVHGDAEKSCGPKCLNLRFHFLQVAAYRLLALVNAEDRLKTPWPPLALGRS
jgi:hypothetical protein